MCVLSSVDSNQVGSNAKKLKEKHKLFLVDSNIAQPENMLSST